MRYNSITGSVWPEIKFDYPDYAHDAFFFIQK